MEISNLKVKMPKIDKAFAKKVGVTVLVVFGLIIAVQVVAAEKYQAVVRVTKEEGTVGINPLADKLDFGDLSGGSSAIRYVTLENGGRWPIRIFSIKLGGIADLIDVSRNNFILGSGETEKLEFRLRMPPSANRERYSGWVYLFKIPVF